MIQIKVTGSNMARNLYKIKKSLSIIKESSKLISVCARRHSVWTQDRTVQAPYKDIEIPNCTLYDYVWQNLDKWPDKTAAVCAETGRGYTYEQLFRLTNALAANLRKKFKIKDNDAIALMMPNLPDYPIVAFGILAAGGVITTINPIYTAHEVQRQLLLSEAKIIITIPEIVPVVKNALNIAKLNIPIIVLRTDANPAPEGCVLLNELSEDVHVDMSCLKEVRRTVDDLCFLPYSSGTTGMPKGVELINRNLIANCEQINEPKISAERPTSANHQDAVMAVLPFFHIYGAVVVMFHKLSLGLKLVTLAKFQPEIFLKAIKKHRTNVIFTAPPLVLLMGSHPLGSPKLYESVEVVINGAAPLSATDVERFIQKAQHKIDFRQGYGLTETSPTVCLTEKDAQDFSSVGLPVPSTQLKIVDGNLNALGPNEKGELLIKGPQVMRGYRKNPEANAEAFTQDGWFRTGDLAIIDDKGVTTIADRLKELIKVKGFQVPPAELEGVLREHPAVADAGVIGVPHPTKGEAPKAFIVIKKDTTVNEDDIKNFVKEKVAHYKKIDDIVFIDSIPKSATGKILRRQLKEKYC